MATTRMAVRVGAAGIAALMGLVTAAAAQKGKPGPPPPPPQPLTAVFSDGDNDNVRGDGLTCEGPTSCYDGYHLTSSSVADGAFIGSGGAIEIHLEPEGVTGDRFMRFHFDTPVGTPGTTPCALPADVSAYKVDFRFNLKDSHGWPIGVESIDPGVSIEASATDPPYLAAVINFTPTTSSGTMEVTNVYLSFGQITGGMLTLTRDSIDQWTIDSDAWVTLKCSAKNSRGKVTVYTMGTYYMPLTLTAMR